MSKWKLHRGGVDVYVKDDGFCGGETIVCILNDIELERDLLESAMDLATRVDAETARGICVDTLGKLKKKRR